MNEILHFGNRDIDVSGLLLEPGKDYYVHRVYRNGVQSLVVNPVRAGAIGGFRYAQWTNKETGGVSVGIYQESIWTDTDRPVCDPTGMFKGELDGKVLWMDIDPRMITNIGCEDCCDNMGAI